MTSPRNFVSADHVLLVSQAAQFPLNGQRKNRIGCRIDQSIQRNLFLISCGCKPAECLFSLPTGARQCISLVAGKLDVERCHRVLCGRRQQKNGRSETHASIFSSMRIDPKRRASAKVSLTETSHHRSNKNR
jgi:hypothetical protein